MNRRWLCWLALGTSFGGALDFSGHGADQTQWGQAWSRNMVSDEKNLPESFDPKTGRNIRWSARLGSESHATPLVAGGRVYIGTNNGEPRDPKHQGDRGVLMCFDELRGQFLWQLVVPKREEDPYFDWPNSGICSPVTVEGDRVYVVNNRGEVMCLDAHGTTNREADILWLFNLTTGAGIWSHDAAHSSILIHGNDLYLNTSTGVDNTHRRIRTPEAPSLVVLDKATGQLIGRENEHLATNIFHNTWSAPSMGTVGGRSLIFFAGGNGVVYAFETLENAVAASQSKEAAGPHQSTQHSNTPTLHSPIRLKKVWQFDTDPAAPKGDIHPYLTNRQEGPSNVYGMPVFYRNRIYVAGGGDIFWGKNEAWLKCIDATRTGDITTNGLVWSCPLERHVLSTPAIWDGLVFVADCGHNIHCVDAETGKPWWKHEIEGEAWASPLAADGKVFLGTRSGAFYVFAASKEKQVLATIEMGSPMSGTATAANGVLYLATMTRLYAIQKSVP